MGKYWKYWKYWKIGAILLLIYFIASWWQTFNHFFNNLMHSFLSLNTANQIIIVVAIIGLIGTITPGFAGVLGNYIQAKISAKESRDQNTIDYNRKQLEEQKEKIKQEEEEQKEKIKQEEEEQKQAEDKQFNESQSTYRHALSEELQKEAGLLFSSQVTEAELLVQREHRITDPDLPGPYYDPVQHILELERSEKGEKLQIYLEKKEGVKLYTLYGGPGSGKTLYLKIIALRAARQHISVGDVEVEYPIYIDLKGFKDFIQQQPNDNDALKKFIALSLKKYGFPENQTVTRIGELLKNALLLLDNSGDIFNDEPNSYNEIIRSIYTQLSNLKTRWGFPAIIATRMLPSIGERGVCLIIENVTPDTTRFFIENCLPPSVDEAKLEDALGNFPRFRNFISTPLALSHVISMYSHTPSKRSLFGRRAELYQSYIDDLLNNRKFVDRDRSPLTSKQKLDLLASIAWELHNNNKCNLAKGKIDEYIEKWLKENQIEVEQQDKQMKIWDKILDELIFRHGLLREHIHYEEVYEFSSLALQEYFAMLHASNKKEKLLTDLYNRRNNLWWEEVIALFIQHNASAMKEVTTTAQANPDASLPPVIDSPYHLVETLARSTTPAEEYHADLLLAGKGLVDVLPKHAALLILHREIHQRMYRLLVSSVPESPLPLFIQIQIAYIFLEESIEDIDEETISQITESPLREELKRIWNQLSSGEPIPILFLPLLVSLSASSIKEDFLLDLMSIQPTDFEEMITDSEVAVSVRKQFIYILCMRRQYSFSQGMYNIIKAEKGEEEIRQCLAAALGILSKNQDIKQLIELLENDTISDNIRWHIINALGTLIERGYATVTASLSKWYQNTERSTEIQKKYLRLHIASILLGRKGEGNTVFKLSPVQFNGDDTIHKLALALLETNKDNHIQKLFEQLLSAQGGTLTEEQKIWICEILARVCKNKEKVQELSRSWNPSDGPLKEALAHLQWRATRRQNSEPVGQAN